MDAVFLAGNTFVVMDIEATICFPSLFQGRRSAASYPSAGAAIARRCRIPALRWRDFVTLRWLPSAAALRIVTQIGTLERFGALLAFAGCNIVLSALLI